MEQDQTTSASDRENEKVEITNPAKRLHVIIEPILRMADGAQSLQVWATAFGMDQDAAQQDPHDVVSHIRKLRDEVALLRRQMAETSFTSDLYEPALDGLVSAMSVTNLTSPWGNFKRFILPEHMLALRWCSQAVESEVGLSHAELQRLLDAIAEFRTSVEDDDLPEAVRAFVLHQLDLMIKGIHEYPIRGRQSIRDAVKEASIDVLHDHEDVATAAPANLREKLAGFWKTGLGVAEGGEKMIKLATGVADAVPKLVNAVHTAMTALT
ncbi:MULTISPECIES: hypothetical protein [unclassified Duganella]|uniref:hypothetical protein n=1 Tax=unclassified Duganella TaxID=2636909 RepID=UPI0011C181EB|nr:MULTISPECIES: hypothetical protein [unclassified Duganella]